MIKRMPKPSLLIFAADETPHFIDFSPFNTLNANDNMIWIQIFGSSRVLVESSKVN